jgi:hypothetical protein
MLEMSGIGRNRHPNVAREFDVRHVWLDLIYDTV